MGYPDWQYNEFDQCGTDYADAAEVAAYDAQMGRFRDIAAENARIFAGLNLRGQERLVEFGVGTGGFAVEAARRCAHVDGVDVSRAMLDYTRGKAEAAGIRNLSLHHAGFLTYEHPGPPADGVVTQVALHHLPDFWKGVALRRIHDILAPGGVLYLRDVVFSFDMADYATHVGRWVSGLREKAGEVVGQQTAGHIRDEHSTLSWVLEGLIERAGFTIREAGYDAGMMAEYWCVKGTRAATL